MSTKKIIKPPEIVGKELSIKDLTEVLIRHYGLKEGRYELLIQFKIGMGSAGPTPEEKLPSAIVGLNKISLVKTEGDGPMVVDASEICAED